VGWTRWERFMIPEEGGGTVARELCVRLDAEEHPELLAEALAGTLHRVAGPPLAVPFVVLDRPGRRLIQVVPEARRHELLTLRAAWLAGMAEDGTHLEPWMLEPVTVIGLPGLRAAMGSGPTVRRAPDAAVLADLGLVTAVEEVDDGDDLEDGLTLSEVDLDGDDDGALADVGAGRGLMAPLAELMEEDGDDEGELLRAVESLESEGPQEGRSEATPATLPGAPGARIVPKDPEAEELFDPQGAARGPASLWPRLRRLGRWAGDGALARARRAVGESQVDRALRAHLDAARRVGLPLSDGLLDVAVRLGVADDEADLVQELATSFEGVAAAPDRAGLGTEQVAEGWERHLEALAERELDLPPPLQERAWAAIREARGGDGDLDAVRTDELADLDVSELVLLLEHPQRRLSAALELVRRGDPDLAEPVVAAVRRMQRAEVLEVVPALVGLGPSVGDALIAGLRARKTYVRQAIALALGELRAGRAVVPLLHLLRREASPVWREVARILGTRFGAAPLRLVLKQLDEDALEPERAVRTLAYLQDVGSRRTLEEVASGDGGTAEAARRALAEQAEATGRNERVTSAGDEPPQDPVEAFSWRFHRVLAEQRAPGTRRG
jgi:hypothetical protein